jgi:hypothetical protein
MADIRIEYSDKKKSSLFMFWFKRLLKWIMALGIVTCPIVNHLTGGPLWSVVADVAMVFFWIEVLSPDVLENNMLRQVFRLGSFAIIETTLIGIFLSPGWLGFVLPIIGFGILLISVILFVINLDKHRNCIMPLILETLIALVAFIVMVNITEQLNWPMITLGAVSSFVAFTGLVIFHKDIWVELRKRLHIK